MRFKKLKIKNIRSYKELEISFPQGSTLLAGEVGAGKTSILLAIEYALFGLQPGQKGSSLLRNNEDTAEVSLELEIDGESILIDRKLKRTHKGVSNEYAAITTSEGKKESSITEIKSVIIDFLGYPQEFLKKNNALYRYTVHSPQEQMKQIILEDSETRLNALRSVFGIDKYRQIKDNLSSILTELKIKARELEFQARDLEEQKEKTVRLETGISSISSEISKQGQLLTERISERKIHEQDLERFREKLEEQRNLKKESEKTQILISAKHDALLTISREKSEISAILSAITSSFNPEEYSEIILKIKQKKDLIEEVRSELSRLLSRQHSLREESNEILTKKDRVFKIDMCPTCLQDVSENHKHNIFLETEKRLNQNLNAQEEISSQAKSLQNKLDIEKTVLETLEQKRSELDLLRDRIDQSRKYRDKLGRFDNEYRALESDMKFLHEHQAGLKSKILEFSIYEQKFSKKASEIELIGQEEKKLELTIAGLQKELDLSKKEIVLLNQKIFVKEKSKESLKELNDLTDWLSVKFTKLIEFIERNILLSLRNEFAALFKKWFLMLVSEKVFETQIDETFTPLIIQGDSEMEYGFLSGGERTAVALAYRLALNQTINSLLSRIRTRGLIILDEPTDGFSEVQIDKMREIFEELKSEQLIIVSHEQKIEGFVDNVIRVKKDGDESRVEQDTATNQKT